MRVCSVVCVGMFVHVVCVMCARSCVSVMCVGVGVTCVHTGVSMCCAWGVMCVQMHSRVFACLCLCVCSCGVWGVVQHVCVRMMCWCVCVCAGVFMWHVCVCARVCVPAPELEPSPLLTRAGPTGDTEAAAAQPCTQFGPLALRPQSADSRGQVVLWLVGVSPQSPGVAAAPPHTCFLPLNSVLFLP